MAELLNKNRPVLDLKLENGAVTQLRIIEENRAFLPLPFISELFNRRSLTEKTVNEWLKLRRIPEGRDGLAEVKKKFGELPEEKHFFSLTDQYWIRNSAEESWEKLNFFTNAYSRVPGDMFFVPWQTEDEKERKAPSPDRTTGGVLRKRWLQDPETLESWLYKAGSVRYHQEPLSEVVASRMLGQLGLVPYVTYELVIHGTRLCSRCKNFITADTELVTGMDIFRFLPREKGMSLYEHMLRVCERLHLPDADSFLDRMILCDHILCNYDRNFGNFGAIRSAETGKFIGFAPLFDNGSAYWGESSEVKQKSSWFEEQKGEILKEAAQKGLLAGIRFPEYGRQLIREYPNISGKKREEILEAVNEMEKGIREIDRKYGEKGRRKEEERERQ